MRILRHLITGQILVRRALPPASFTVIEQAIKQSETSHAGEIVFAVEAALDVLPLLKNQSARERAIDVFSLLRVWDTPQNNGVLIYLLFADHDVEIVADRGIHAKVGQAGWEAICHKMEAAFQRGQFEAGIIAGVSAITQQLQTYFPAESVSGENALPDRPVVLK